jgi:lysophospholipase L1-like esterase
MNFRLRFQPKHSVAAIACLATALPVVTAHAQTDFALKSGDRVVFYGDSITDQRMYTLLTEEYIVTRFPNREIRFVHSGWGGDRVTGGGGGPIDLRLDRDVTAYKPTVVTIMLGMNDASYRAYDDNIFKTYSDGFKHMVDKIKKDNPGVRLTFIQPSPFDDVTRPPAFEGGYNAVLVKYGAFLATLATTDGATVADLNTPVVAMLTKANATDSTIAQKIIPDRVHPGWGGHLIMAEGLLKSWNAPALVSSVTMDASTKKAETQNAEIKNVKADQDGSLTWNVMEGALPFPILPPDPRNPDTYNLALKSSDFIEALDREILTVSNLTAANYNLKIDGEDIGTFTKEQLAAGINLATLPTPMLKQAELVAEVTQTRSNLHNARWREYQVPKANDKTLQPLLPALMKEMDAADSELAKAQYETAKPRTHNFSLVPKA